MTDAKLHFILRRTFNGKEGGFQRKRKEQIERERKGESEREREEKESEI